MATNPIGKGTKTLGINMQTEKANDIEKRAKSMGVSVGFYTKAILRHHLESGQKLTISEE